MKKIAAGNNIEQRVYATIVDYGIYYVLFFLYVYAFGQPNDEGGYSVTGFPALVAPTFWFFYFPFTESLGGQTLGHYLAGIKVVDEYGRNIGFGTAFKRRFFDWLDFIFFGLLAYIIVKNNDHRQRIGDLVAKTVVVGAENVACQFCGEDLKLTPKESVKRSFSCPTCRNTTFLDENIAAIIT